jgi:predicted O-methyltransferase YrrM
MNYQKVEKVYSDSFETINGKISSVSQMSRSEREFLHTLIVKHQPQKILELGVAEGASSAIILNAISGNKNSFLYSVDYSERYYMDINKNTGWICNEVLPNTSNFWKLFTGELANAFMEYIGNGIDCILLDTTHSNPGEILDYLIVLPYLTEKCLVIIHDISLYQCILLNSKNQFYHTGYDTITCRLLFSCLKGTKLLPSVTEAKYFANIGAVLLSPPPLIRTIY